MADKDGTERPDHTERSDQQKLVTADLGGAVEWIAEVTADSPLNAEWSTVLGGLPDLSPEEAMAFYRRASQDLPATRVRGFYGASAGSEQRADDAVLFLYRDDPRHPVLKLVMTQSEIVQFADALSDLVERFRP